MQYGCCVNMLPDVGTLAGANYLAPLKALGYDYVEMPLKALTLLPSADFAAVLQMQRDSGLPCRICNDFLLPEFRIVGPETTPQNELNDYFKRAFDRIGPNGMGAETVVFGSPWSKNCPEGFSRETAWEQIKTFLFHAAETAKACGIEICVEFNNRTETNMVTRFSDSVRIVCEVAHDNLTVHCDYYHIIMERDDPAAITDGGDRIRHVHIAELNRAHLTEHDRNNAQLLAFANALKTIHYNGTISMEARPITADGWFSEAKTSLSVLHDLFD